KSEVKSIGIVVNKLILAATIYFIWQERNMRMFKDERRIEEAIIKIIYDYVISKLMSVFGSGIELNDDDGNGEQMAMYLVFESLYSFVLLLRVHGTW
ncbi:hypothetical protein Tco_1095416, partial [Tanacetum coccineum]